MGWEVSRYRETPLITFRVARDLVRLGRHDAILLNHWRNGMDTHQIAAVLTVHESEVANRLFRIRPPNPLESRELNGSAVF